MGEAIATLNQITQQTASRLGVAVALTHQWFEGRQAELISGYRTGRIRDALQSSNPPIHPNDRGHKVIAQGLSSFI